MRKSLASFGGLLLFASALAAAPCAPSATSLCLSEGRFEVSVGWKDFANRTGFGRAVPLTPDTGYFWFFSDSNIELIVKVLDARGINGKFWVFFGALSNIEYTLTVRDLVTGATKQYLNPSGRFASVGDTLAFDGAAAAAVASRDTVVAPGTAAPAEAVADIQRWIARPKAATDFTPCAETRFGFDIGSCRFHVEVEWDDGHGNTGRGQPVQLTNDTGYFWFFSPSNVELMIKVLDARPINGKLWVFFGALSNVQYTVKITDRITGAFRKYSNPAGTFASVGDTGAFDGGRSVTPATDSGLAVSADIDLAGGSVAAASADGTLFILDVPARALSVPRTVTLKPVTRVDGLPFSGGLVAGVEIEPAGLELLVPATLTIRPVSAPPPERTLPYSHAPGGEDFILYPRDRDLTSLRLPVDRLGGYGVADGGLNEAEAQAARAATAPLNPYLQRYALEVLRRASGLITAAELESRGAQIFREAYHEQVEALLSPTGGGAATSARVKRSCYLGEMQEFLDLLFRWIREGQMLGLPDAEGNAQAGAQVAIARIRACAEESFRLCVENHDPGEILFLLRIVPQLQQLGFDDPALTTMMDGSLVERCLRFELEFTSEFKLEQIHPEFQLTESVGYHATVPLRFLYGGNAIFPNMSTFEGGCALQTDGATMTLMANPDSHCRAGSAAAGPGWFWVKTAQINLSILSNELWMVYDVGYPSFQASIVCDGGALDVSLIPFGATYLIVHEGELSPAYGLVVNNWRQLRYLGSSPGDWAEKEYIRTLTNYGGPGTVLFETTRFFLRHTPDGPGCQ